MNSTEMNVRDVQIKITEMTDPEEIRSFISGDERKTVIDAAHKRIIEMMGKTGETGPITETKADMKNPAAKTAGYLNVRSSFYHIRSLTPQQAAGKALAIRFKEGLQRTKSDNQNPPSIPPLLRGDTEGLWRNPISPARTSSKTCE